MEKKNRDEYYKAYYQANKKKYAERGKAWRAANPDKALALDRKWKAKNHDKIVKYRERTKEKRNTWQREYEATRRDPIKRLKAVRKWQAKHGKRYREENSDRIKVLNAAWQSANVEHVKAYRKSNAGRARELSRKRARDKSVIERRRKTQAEWYKKNPEKRRENHKRWFAKNGKQWREKNRGRLRAHSARYKATQLKATPVWANLKKIEIMYGQASKLGLEVDHIVPLQGKNVCGLHVENNLQLLECSKNRSKGNRFEHEHIALSN